MFVLKKIVFGHNSLTFRFYRFLFFYYLKEQLSYLYFVLYVMSISVIYLVGILLFYLCNCFICFIEQSAYRIHHIKNAPLTLPLGDEETSEYSMCLYQLIMSSQIIDGD